MKSMPCFKRRNAIAMIHPLFRRMRGTDIKYQIASYLILQGMVDENLDIVHICRQRHDGIRQNLFNEYECGYGHALSSYGLLQALTGA